MQGSKCVAYGGIVEGEGVKLLALRDALEAGVLDASVGADGHVLQGRLALGALVLRAVGRQGGSVAHSEDFLTTHS